MSLETLVARYYRLRQELDLAYRRKPWLFSTIDQLANEISSVERSIASLRG